MRALRNLLLLLLVFAAGSCSEPTSAPVDIDGASGLPDLSGLPLSPLIAGANSASCGIPTDVGLMLGPDLRTGSVQVTNDDANLYVRYQSEPGRSVLATALFAGSSVSEIPTTRRGLPQILRFPYKSGHPRGTKEVIWQIPLADLPDEEVVIAAFAQIGFLPSWAEGEPISPGRDWAMYFTYRIASCASGTVGPDGGRVSFADGNAVLDIPAGALTEPVLITITPTTVEEIQEHIAELGWPFAAPDATRGLDSAAAAPGSADLTMDANLELLPQLAGIRPIPGTLWDFSPDGLRFQKSGTVTLRYRDQDLPPGTDERLLGVWLINGVIPYDRVGTVDVVANTITASIDHFSYGFIGFRETIAADLAISRSGASTDQVAPGEAVTYAATLTNLGPGSVTDAFVLYQGFGNVVGGTLNAGCTQDAAPVFATVLIRCEVGTIAVGTSVQAPAASFIPQAEGEFEVWIDPSSSGTTDSVPANNRFTETFTAVAATVNADLAINAVVTTSDTIELGLPVGFTATIQNHGPETAPAARVLYSMFGNAVAGPVVPGCTVASAPIVADVEIACIIGDLADGAAAQAPSASFVPQGVGNFTVWVSSGSLATDPNTANNRQELSVAVLQRQADLELQSILDAPDPADVGVPIVYTVDYLSAHAAQPVDGAQIRLLYGANATFVSSSVEGCAPVATFVTCPTGTLVEGLIEGMTITLLPADGVSELVITASILAPFPITDPDPSNNLQAETTTIGFGGSADLAIATLSESADPITPGQSVTYRATVQSFGPDAVDDAVVYYQVFGDIIAGPLNPACTQTSVPAIADVEIVCAVGVVDADSVVLAPPAAFVPQSPGTYTVWVSSGSSASDPNPDNNRFETTVTASAPTADLRIDQLTDSPDPVDAGGEVTYQIQAIAMGTTTAIDGAVLQLLFTGNVQYVRSSLACSPIVGGVGCPLGALQPGVVLDVDVVTVLPTAGQTVSAQATIVVPAGVSDLDLSNNVRTTQTTVSQSGPTAITVGQVIQRPLPAGGLTDHFQVAGAAGQQVRISLSSLGAKSATAELTVSGPTGALVPAPGSTSPVRASELSSKNLVLTLPATGAYDIGVKSFGYGDYRLGLGTGVGRMDPTFGPYGLGYVKIQGNSSSQAYFLDMRLVDNDIVTTGGTYLSRFDASGNLVASFGTGGQVDVFAALGGRVTSMGVQPDGKIVVAAPSITSPYPWIVGRFNSDGSPDNTFGTNGVMQVPVGGNRNSARPAAIGFYQDGGSLDIVVAGDAGALQEQVGIVRLNSNGTLDPAFGNGGIVFENGGFAPEMMEVQPDGRVLVGSGSQLRRYTASGARDANFGASGLVVYPDNWVYKIRLLSGGDILAVGGSGSDALAIRLHPDGSLDGSFGTGGYARYDFGLPDRFQDVTEDSQGRLVIAGYQRTGAGWYDQLVVRMSANGVLDANFAVGGYLLEGMLDDARAVLLDSQGRIIVGGQGRNAFGLHISRHLPD